MGWPFETEVSMFRCVVCHGEKDREELVNEVFRIDGKYVLVDHIPATVCARCGEEIFSRETTEKIRVMVHGQGKPARAVALEVFEFA